MNKDEVVRGIANKVYENWAESGESRGQYTARDLSESVALAVLNHPDFVMVSMEQLKKWRDAACNTPDFPSHITDEMDDPIYKAMIKAGEDSE